MAPTESVRYGGMKKKLKARNPSMAASAPGHSPPTRAAPTVSSRQSSSTSSTSSRSRKGSITAVSAATANAASASQRPDAGGIAQRAPPQRDTLGRASVSIARSEETLDLAMPADSLAGDIR